MTGWVGRTSTEIAAAVQAGDVTAREVAAEHLDRIAAIDGELGVSSVPEPTTAFHSRTTPKHHKLGASGR